MKLISILLLVACGLLPSTMYCQTQTEFDIWAERVNWDGFTPWQFLLTISPEFMGPNALPVPRLQEGEVDSNFVLEIRPEYYHGKGDKTYDLYIRAYYPIVEDRIALEGFIVMQEYYNMDLETIIERSARTVDGKGRTTGDLYLTVIFQLLKDHSKLPDIALDVTLKTASGGALLDARYNDAAGYYFMLSGGKNIISNEEKKRFLRLHAMLGFYVWQIYTDNQQQNDAISYGLGLDLQLNQWTITNSFSGYQGYIGNGDRPVQYQLDFNYRHKVLGYGMGYTAGLKDYPYHSVRFSTMIYFQ